MQAWYWRKLPLRERTGSEIFAALFYAPNQRSSIQLTPFPYLATLLESPYPMASDYSALSRYSICAQGPRLLAGQLQWWTPGIGTILSCLRQLLRKAQATGSTLFGAQLGEAVDSALPFTGGWLGWLGYDLAWEIEHLPYQKSDTLLFPIACWYEPEQFAILDHYTQSLWLAATQLADLDQLEARLQQDLQLSQTSDLNLQVQIPQFHTNQANYEKAIMQAKQYIQAGEIFQANLSLRFRTQTPADAWNLYQTLQQINPSPFACYWHTPWGVIISCSPERLIQVRGRQVQTRPIAGTRPRGQTHHHDQLLATELSNNAKERAEHIMLVDLERSDLGRVCEWGSVTVDELLTIERYSHVMHLVSNIKGILQSQKTAIDLIQAVFPGGTITGCPKVRCMEIIEELEPERRNLFYGSCGYLDWRGNLDLNILIRTLLWQSGLKHPLQPVLHTVWGQVGAGIVADSDPEREWHEALTKAQAQLAALACAQVPP